MKSQIGQWGNSLAVRLPKHISQSLGLKVNDRLSITEDGGRIMTLLAKAIILFTNTVQAEGSKFLTDK